MSPLLPLWEDIGLGSARQNFGSRRFVPAPGCLASRCARDAKPAVGLLPSSGFFSKLEHPQRCSWESICSPRKPLGRAMGVLEDALTRREAAGPLGGARGILQGKSGKI